MNNMGEEADIFVLKPDGSVINLMAYSLDEGNALNLSDILPDAATDGGSASSIDDYARLLGDGFNPGQVQSDADGAANGVHFTTIATVDAAVTQAHALIGATVIQVDQIP